MQLPEVGKLLQPSSAQLDRKTFIVMTATILLVLAALAFIVAAVGQASIGGLQLVPAGLAFGALAFVAIRLALP